MTIAGITLTNNQIINIIAMTLGSSVVAAIISSFVSIHNNSKNVKLEYITKERSKWRCEIREIAVELEKTKVLLRKSRSESDSIRIVLAKLKVRINANGLLDNATFKEDKHIWEKIICIEKYLDGSTNNANDKEILKKLENLIRDLCHLLKDDWEKSKSEVSFKCRLIYLLKKIRKKNREKR